jgi:nucleoside-diphosphate-sugar epimerase
MPPRSLIVGCGYVGERVATRLHQAGQDVFAVTRSADRAQTFLERGWTPVVADVMQPQPLRELPQFDSVLYAVGFDHTAGVSKRDVYVQGFSRVLEVLSGRCHRFVAISSSSVYGQNDGELVDESSPAHPSTESGQICLDAEQALWSWRDQQTRTIVNVLRLAGIYGPRRLLARLETLRAGQPLSGRPDAWLNLIHGDDAASLAIAAMEHGRDRSVYLGVDEEPVRRGDFYLQLARLIGAPLPKFSGEPGLRARGSENGLNKRLTNPQTRQELAVRLRFPCYREGLEQSIAADQRTHGVEIPSNG